MLGPLILSHGRWVPMSVKAGDKQVSYFSITILRYGLRLASMTVENEIVMIGGIEQSSGSVFGQPKVR